MFDRVIYKPYLCQTFNKMYRSMNRKKMMKKHLLTYSVILVLAVILKLNICSSTVEKPAGINRHIPRFIAINNTTASDYNFANESLPSNSAVYRKLQNSLRKHNYSNVGSHILQIKAGELFPVIEPILKRFGIPDDFKYLPLVESGLHEGTSTRGAAGLWQFMPGTARTYGLKVGHGVDERRNVRKSTIAACKYIRELYAQFNSWTLAAAAYNNGEIKLAKAMNRQNEDNYFRMKLNRETASYVYNLIAMKAIIADPQKYGYGGYYAHLPVNNFMAYN